MTFPGASGDTEATPDAGSGGQDGGKGAEARIGQLVQQRNQWKSQVAERDNQISTLTQRLDRLEQGGQQSADSLQAASFADLPAGDLKEQYASAIQNADGNLAAELQFEMNRRMTTQASSRTADELRGENQVNQYKAGIQQEIQTRFAHELASADGPVVQKADQYARHFQSSLGGDILQKSPEYTLLSLALASNDVQKKTHADEVERLQNELAQLREGHGLQEGLREAASMSDASREALKKGDIKGAFANLGIVQNLGR